MRGRTIKVLSFEELCNIILTQTENQSELEKCCEFRQSYKINRLTFFRLHRSHCYNVLAIMRHGRTLGNLKNSKVCASMRLSGRVTSPIKVCNDEIAVAAKMRRSGEVFVC